MNPPRIITLLTFVISIAYCQITMTPDTTSSSVSVDLKLDSRSVTASEFENNGVYDNKWRINQKYDGVKLADWPLTMTLAANQYGFQAEESSSLKITMDASCISTQCDAFWAFGIGNQQYVTFVNDFDGGWKKKASSPSSVGIYIYPSCGTSNSVISGDASTLISSTTQGLRNAIAGGDKDNWNKLSGSNNDKNFPVTFEFINNAVADTFTIRFISPKFTSGLECVYGSSVQTLSDFKLFLTPDDDNELGLLISSFQIEGINIGNPVTNNPSVNPSVIPTNIPTNQPSVSPTQSPSRDPSKQPSTAPSEHPFDRYEIGPNPVTFAAAQAYCNTLQKTLAIIRNSADNDVVHRLCDYKDSNKVNGCWIGLLKNENNVFQWEDGNNYMLEYLSADLPIVTDFDNNCVAVPQDDESNLKWKTYSCDQVKYPICDHPTFAPSESPTVQPTQSTSNPSVPPTKPPTQAPTSCEWETRCSGYGKNCNANDYSGWSSDGLCGQNSYTCDCYGCGFSTCCSTCYENSYNCKKLVCSGSGRRLLESEINKNQ